MTALSTYSGPLSKVLSANSATWSASKSYLAWAALSLIGFILLASFPLA